MLAIVVEHDAVRIGASFAVTFQRTLRIPDDGRTYPLPPGFGRFPVLPIQELGEAVPAEWRGGAGVVIPMHQGEALWLGFEGAPWRPNAVQVAVGGVNAITGTPWEEGLTTDPQNYLVCPNQPWLDGIKAGEGFIRQFVAMPLGLGYTVEGQVTGQEAVGGLQLRVYEPKPGRFPTRPPRRPPETDRGRPLAAPLAGGAMGLGAGGKMAQRVYPDPYGYDTWDPSQVGTVDVHLLNSLQYRALTGRDPPPTPISAETYTAYGFPWFRLYDEDQGDVRTSRTLADVKTVREKAAETGTAADQLDEASVSINPAQITKLRRPHGPRRPKPGSTQ